MPFIEPGRLKPRPLGSLKDAIEESTRGLSFPIDPMYVRFERETKFYGNLSSTIPDPIKQEILEKIELYKRVASTRYEDPFEDFVFPRKRIPGTFYYRI